MTQEAREAQHDPAPEAGATLDTGGNIACLRRDSCTQLFFVYAGKQGMVEGMGPMTFLQKSGLSNRNVAFIRDPHACFFDRGVSDDIPDLEALLDWHAAHIARHPQVTEIYCVGNSFGGWAALFFGYMLAVHKVWALAPGGENGLPLLQGLMKDGNGVTEYEVHYSRKIDQDRAFAESLESFDGISLVQNDAHGHLMVRGLLHTGELAQMFPPLRQVAGAAD